MNQLTLIAINCLIILTSLIFIALLARIAYKLAERRRRECLAQHAISVAL